MLRLILILSSCGLASSAPACETALLLAVDVSGSISNDEYRLQMTGLAEALNDPDIIDAIVEGHDALALVQWSGADLQTLGLEWRRPGNAAEVATLAAKILTIKRPYNTATSIGQAIRYSLPQFGSVPDCLRHILDVSGDGMENDGMTLPIARAEAQSAGVTINGIAIEVDASSSELTDYYRRLVISSDGFVMTAHGLADYPRAIHSKLTRELVDPTS